MVCICWPMSLWLGLELGLACLPQPCDVPSLPSKTVRAVNDVRAGTVHTGVDLVMPSHFSVAIALDPRKSCLAVFDSHSRDGRCMKFGASIAVASLDDVGILHMAEFLDFA